MQMLMQRAEKEEIEKEVRLPKIESVANLSLKSSSLQAVVHPLLLLLLLRLLQVSNFTSNCVFFVGVCVWCIINLSQFE